MIESAVLINPPYDHGLTVSDIPNSGREFSLNRGLGVLGCALKSQDIKVTYLDYPNNVFLSHGRDWIDNNSLVGISFGYKQYKPSVKLVSDIKSVYPDSFVVLGGILPTLFPRETLSKINPDAVVIGRGDHIIKELADHHFNNRLNLNEIQGIGYSSKNNAHFTERRRQNEKLIKPDPEYYGYEFILATRGCEGLCNFCFKNAENDLKCKQELVCRDPDEVIDDIELGVSKGSNSFNLEDISVGVHAKLFDKLYDSVISKKLPNDLKLAFCTRIDDYKSRESIFEKLLDTGVGLELEIGFEAGTSKNLKALCKRITVEDSNYVLDSLVRFGEKYNEQVMLFPDYIPFLNDLNEEEIIEQLTFFEKLTRISENLRKFSVKEFIRLQNHNLICFKQALSIEPFTPLARKYETTLLEEIKGKDVLELFSKEGNVLAPQNNLVSKIYSDACAYSNEISTLFGSFANNVLTWEEVTKDSEEIEIRHMFDYYTFDFKSDCGTFLENYESVKEKFYNHKMAPPFLFAKFVERLRTSRLVNMFLKDKLGLDVEDVISDGEYQFIVDSWLDYLKNF